MKKRKQIILLASLIILLFVINYSFIDSAVIKFLDEKESVFIERVIDGDTVVVDNKSVRLLGINSPERGEVYYKEAKDFLEKLLLNKNVVVEGNKKDKYYRELKYIFLGEKNINLESVRNGFANVYILDDKKYEKELRNAWEECIEKNKNLCEKSVDECSDCIELKYFENQKIIFYNKCNFNCDLKGWEIKDEGRKKFVFPEFILEKNKEIKIIVGEGIDGKEKLFWRGKDYVWTNTGDTLFLRDGEGRLVLWESY